MTGIFTRVLPVFFLLFIFYFNYGSSQLLCWGCDPCPEPFDNSSSLVSLLTCSTPQIVCVKNTLRVLNQASYTVKGCVRTCTAAASDFFGEGTFVDCCNTDYCNLSTRNQQSLSIYLLLISLFVLLTKVTFLNL